MSTLLSSFRAWLARRPKKPYATPVLPPAIKALNEMLRSVSGLLHTTQAKLIAVTKERDEAREHVCELCRPLHDFMQTCGKFDGSDAGRCVAKTAVKFALEYKSELEAQLSESKKILSLTEREYSNRIAEIRKAHAITRAQLDCRVIELAEARAALLQETRRREAANARYDEVLGVLLGEDDVDLTYNEAAQRVKDLMELNKRYGPLP